MPAVDGHYGGISIICIITLHALFARICVISACVLSFTLGFTSRDEPQLISTEPQAGLRDHAKTQIKPAHEHHHHCPRSHRCAVDIERRHSRARIPTRWCITFARYKPHAFCRVLRAMSSSDALFDEALTPERAQQQRNAEAI